MVIPEDLLIEILKRLPVKSLCRFRCVSTLWRSIISDPLFIGSHFAHSDNQPKLVMSLPSQPDSDPPGRCFFTVTQSEPGNQQPHIALPYFIAPGTAHRYVSQSLHGLICFQVDVYVGICNPSTGKYVTTRALEGKITGECAYLYYSFGYDPVEKKHKVLSTLATCRKSMPDLREVIMENHVLDLGSEKWRRIEDGPPHLKKENEICFNGLIYYRAWNSNITNPRQQDFLVEFNVGTESFRMVKFPGDNGPRGGHGKICLIEFEGRVAVADVRNLKRDGSDDVVLLISEDFERDIWRKKVIALPPPWKEILAAEEVFLAGTVGTGELLLASQIMSKPQRVFYYNLKTNSIHWIEISGLLEYKRVLPPAVWQTFTHHVESLLPLEGLQDRQLHLT